MLEDAFALKVSFAFVGRIANMYSQVSQRCLLPQMREVQRIGLPGSSQTSAQMEGKKEMLRRICNESEDEVRRLTNEVSRVSGMCLGLRSAGDGRCCKLVCVC